jgi:hypothetical protein
MSQRKPILLALAAAAVLSGGVAAACPHGVSTATMSELTPRGNNTARYKITYIYGDQTILHREHRPSLFLRLGEFVLAPFALGYAGTSAVLLGRRRRH